MEFHADPSQLSNVTFNEFIATLSSNSIVDGILIMGSTGTGSISPNSDYDLLLVLSVYPAPLRMVTTWVDQRLTEVYCTTTSAIERIVSQSTPWLLHSEEGTILGWLQTGRIAYDRDGRLGGLRDEGRHREAPSSPGEDAIFEAWRKIGYNVAHMRRYAAEDEPVAHVAVDLRLFYSIAEVNGHYFTVRKLPWRGEKAAVRYWMDHDPAYLEILQQYAVETDRQRKVTLYQQLAERALAPVGGLWKAGSTVVASGSAFGSATDQESDVGELSANDLWHNLIATKVKP